MKELGMYRALHWIFDIQQRDGYHCEMKDWVIGDGLSVNHIRLLISNLPVYSLPFTVYYL